MSQKFIKWFQELSLGDVPKVGGKNASLGEMYQKLSKKGIKVPNGFAITASSYFYLVDKAGIQEQIRNILKNLDTHKVKDLAVRGAKIRELILRAKLPQELEQSIIEAYKKLSQFYKTKNLAVAVRSSATAEDLPDASFAGQQETYLNIRGEKELLAASLKCFASLFTNRAISYREDKKFDHFKVGLSIGVQKMVRSDLAASGVAFSLDTESGFSEVVLINAAYGLGENIVQGVVTPDEFYVFKPTLKKGYQAIISKKLGNKKIKMVYNNKGGAPVVNIKVSPSREQQFSLSDKEVLELAKYVVTIEEHYGRPMDIEWAKDGQTNEMFIVQARPETVQSQRNVSYLEEYKLKKSGKVLTRGTAVGAKIGQGKVNVIMEVKNISKFKKGEVLVTSITNPDWEPIMKIASAIVTDSGGRTCHAAIVSRELGIPCVVGSGQASKVLKSGQGVTVSCAEGEEGLVYEGLIPFEVKRVNLKELKRPKTKIMMNVAEPASAFKTSFIPNDGVGLAREEFIINSWIKIHPLALINYEKITKKDKKLKKQIDEITGGYWDKKQFYIDKLSQGVALLASAFYPKPVIIRLVDLKSNEYANLIGGKYFEPEESNPMLGWRGASRYYDKNYRLAFDLECQALKKVRDEMGLVNVKIMVPFCRTVEEGKKVIEVLGENGLKQGVNGLEIICMTEIPSNVLLLEEFAKIFDGFSIGSNDLTQLVLGLDRDSGLVSHLFDERNLAVKKLVAEAIQKARKSKRPIGICGQAPSDFPDFAKFLVENGINSISLNPDTVLKTTLGILEVEKKLKR